MYLTFLKNINTRQTQEDYSLQDVLNGIAYQEELPTTIPEKLHTKTVITSRNPSWHNQDSLNNFVSELKILASLHHKDLINNEYNTFHIPKRSGGLREINAPKETLMHHLSTMKDYFQYKFKVLYHDSAYAYVPKRSIVDALKVHQQNNSNWFLKLDIKDFFPSCNQEFVVKQLRKIYPFSTISEEDINEFIWICFRNDELPQGTPMSPMLTNLIMIPIDFAIQNWAKENNYIYTRYADDILISSRINFDWRATITQINTVFTTLRAPFQIKQEKTRYGSSAGRNWNLGLMLNKDHNITVGYRNKKKYKAMLYNLMEAEKTNNMWNKEELYHFQGITSYYLSVEPEYFKTLIKKYEEEYNITLKTIYKKYL